jgi:methyl coenzyme M reductase subunit C
MKPTAVRIVVPLVVVQMVEMEVVIEMVEQMEMEMLVVVHLNSVLKHIVLNH